jgi:hypothetical protein
MNNIIDKIKAFIKQYYIYIIVFLVFVIMIKGCNSSRTERIYEHNISKHEYIIDSLKASIDVKNLEQKCYCDTINALRYENKLIKDVLIDTKKDKEYYRKVNKDLVDVIYDTTDNTTDNNFK